MGHLLFSTFPVMELKSFPLPANNNAPHTSRQTTMLSGSECGIFSRNKITSGAGFPGAEWQLRELYSQECLNFWHCDMLSPTKGWGRHTYHYPGMCVDHGYVLDVPFLVSGSVCKWGQGCVTLKLQLTSPQTLTDPMIHPTFMSQEERKEKVRTN